MIIGAPIMYHLTPRDAQVVGTNRVVLWNLLSSCFRVSWCYNAVWWSAKPLCALYVLVASRTSHSWISSRSLCCLSRRLRGSSRYDALNVGCRGVRTTTAFNKEMETGLQLEYLRQGRSITCRHRAHNIFTHNGNSHTGNSNRWCAIVASIIFFISDDERDQILYVTLTTTCKMSRGKI